MKITRQNEAKKQIGIDPDIKFRLSAQNDLEDFNADTEDPSKLLLSNDDDFGAPLSTLRESDDDSFFDVDDSMFDIVSTEDDVPSPPDTLRKTGISSLMTSLIQDEWDAINGYNSALATLSTEKPDGYETMMKVITDIVNEENVHVGQLQKILTVVSPNAASIDDGEEEAQKTINDVQNSDVAHPGMTVQTHTPIATADNNVTPADTNGEDDYCSVSMVDDEF